MGSLHRRMLTIFSIPKAFTTETSLMQRNAIKSWQRLKNTQVILCGDDDGVAEASAELGCDHFPSLRRTDLGTPRLDDAFAAAEQLARHELICYVNADIILLPGFQGVLATVSEGQFLIAGRRLNVWLSTAISFEREDWDVVLWDWAQREGHYSAPVGSDYFIFRRGTLGAIPPFAVGRPYWDNWMMFMARQRGWSLVDATALIRAIHQNHDYGHVPAAAGGMWEGPEGDDNLRAARGQVYTLVDATHALGSNGLTPMTESEYKLRRLRRRLERLPGFELARSVYRLFRPSSSRFQA
jgi:hypothetical protein